MERQAKPTRTTFAILYTAAICAVVASMTLFGYSLHDALPVLGSLLVSCGVPLLVYRHTRHYSAVGEVALLFAAMAMSLFVVNTIYGATIAQGHPFSAPILTHDDNRYFKWALWRYDGSVRAPACTFIGYPLMLVGTWKVLGVSVVWPLALNVMATLFAFILTARTAEVLLEGRVEARPTVVHATALILCAGLFYLLSQSGQVQKEAMSYLAFALVGYALAVFARKRGERLPWQAWTAFLLGSVIMAMVRTNFVYFFAIGAIIITLGCPKRRYMQGTALFLISAAAFYGGIVLSSYSFQQQFLTIAGGAEMQNAFTIRGAQQPYLAFIGQYHSFPVWRRILLLPLTASVQFVIPFPWVYDRMGNGITVSQVLTRTRWMWYVVGGISLYYYFFVAWRRREGLGSWAWWPATIFGLVAYIIGGTVSRYILPIELIFVPTAVYIILRLREGHYRRSFTVWAVSYIIVLTVTLVVCYHIQTGYLDSLEEYYRQFDKDAVSTK